MIHFFFPLKFLAFRIFIILCVFFLSFSFVDPVFCVSFMKDVNNHIAPVAPNLTSIAPNLTTIQMEIPLKSFYDTALEITNSALDFSSFSVFVPLTMTSGMWSDSKPLNAAVGIGVGLATSVVVNFLRRRLTKSSGSLQEKKDPVLSDSKTNKQDLGASGGSSTQPAAGSSNPCSAPTSAGGAGVDEAGPSGFKNPIIPVENYISEKLALVAPSPASQSQEPLTLRLELDVRSNDFLRKDEVTSLSPSQSTTPNMSGEQLEGIKSLLTERANGFYSDQLSIVLRDKAYARSSFSGESIDSMEPDISDEKHELVVFSKQVISSFIDFL